MLHTLRILLLVGIVLSGSACDSPLQNSIGRSKIQRSSTSDSEGFDVRAFGACGDGKTLDSPAINRAIDAAANAGGGRVVFPAGQYLSTSIHLKSNVCLDLNAGAVIVAADPHEGFRYDLAEPNPSDKWQDFGHSHWHNSLIWGENLHDVSIVGGGMIYGKGLTRYSTDSRTHEQNEALRHAPPMPDVGPFGYPNAMDAVEAGWGNKSIALKLCRNVIIRDITIHHGGHFGILATGLDNLTIDNVKLDTNRDGMDIDCCRNVRISNCSVNSPDDDAICLKTSYALGEIRPCQNITIANCLVSGFKEGTMLDGIFVHQYDTYRRGTPVGRIKFGTESNGDFKNITISNCIFDYCMGLALESVDGARLEDVTIDNITMHDVLCPIFLRLGSRLRGPKETTQIGALSRVTLSNFTVYDAEPKQCCVISGIPGHDVQGVSLSHIHIVYGGGGTNEQGALKPEERPGNYPDPTMFGDMPAYGFYIRHASGIDMDHIDLSTIIPDARPAFVLDGVCGANLSAIRLHNSANSRQMVTRDVQDLKSDASLNDNSTRP